MLKQHQIFFDFLRSCIGSESEIPSSLKEADWKELYVIAKSNAWLVSFLMVSNRPTRCSEPLRFKVGGASKPFAILCGMGPLGNSSLQLIVYS